jgi:hypothetical protein
MPNRSPEELIPAWRMLWLGSIDEIANIHLQRAAWLNMENTNPHWSYIEIRESYCEQIGLYDGYSYAISKRIVSPEEANAVREFDELLQKYKPPRNDAYDYRAILDDPNWHAVTEAAVRAVDALLKLSFNNPSYLGGFR